MEGDLAVFNDSVSDAGVPRPDQLVTQQAGDASKLDASSAGKPVLVPCPSQVLNIKWLISALIQRITCSPFGGKPRSPSLH